MVTYTVYAYWNINGAMKLHASGPQECLGLLKMVRLRILYTTDPAWRGVVYEPNEPPAYRPG